MSGTVADDEAMEDLRVACPRWTRRQLREYRRQYEEGHAERGGVPFAEYARHQREHRQWLLDAGLAADDPPHPDALVVREYDPPLPQCPCKCYMASWTYLEVPEDPDDSRLGRRRDALGRGAVMSVD